MVAINEQFIPKSEAPILMPYYGFRYYDPVTGRWPSRDPLLDEVGLLKYLAPKPRSKRAKLRKKLMSLPAYTFVRNSPVIDFDIDGRISPWVIGGIGGVAGAAWAVCCSQSMAERIIEANDAVATITANWPPSYSANAEGTPMDALQHCIGTCMAIQKPGWCPRWVVKAGRKDADQGEPNDLANNEVGFAMRTGDCVSQCYTALEEGRLTCGGTSNSDPTFPCPPPPIALSSILANE